VEVAGVTPRIQLVPDSIKGEKAVMYSPEYLAHEPPHVPWPLQDAVLVIAGDGVHGEYDHLGTLALRPHCMSSCHRVRSYVSEIWVPGAIAPGGKRDDWGLCHSHHSSDFWRFVPINLKWFYGGWIRAISFCGQIGQNWTLQGAGGGRGEETHTWGMYL